MVQTIVYILPLILGRTFDMGRDRVGVDIFPKETVDHPTVINKTFSETRHKFVENTREARDFLDVGGSFSLKIKGGLLSAGASGSYLADTESKENGVEMLITSRFQTVTETLPPHAVPNPNWRQENSDLLGTHYVRSITYGGELVVSVLLTSNTTREKKHIKGAIDVGGRVAGWLDLEVEVEGEYMKELSEIVDSMEIKYYSSVPISFLPSSMKGLNSLLDTFHDELQKYNGGKGVPIKVELWPLTSLEPTLPRFVKNSALEGYLNNVEDRLDDLLTTRTAFHSWLQNIDHLTDDQEKEAGQFNDALEKVLQEFYKVIGDLDLRLNEKQLSSAIELYDANVEVPIHKPYYSSYLRLRQKVTNDIPTNFWKPVRGNGAAYTHWGGDTCLGIWPEVIAVGYVSSSSSDSTNGIANYLCLTENLTLGMKGSELQMPEIHVTNFDLLISQDDKTSVVNRKGTASCAICELSSAGAIRTFPGVRHCPLHWSVLYEGYLVGNGKDGQLICLNRNAKTFDADQEDKVGWLKNASIRDSTIVPCIVCAN